VSDVPEPNASDVVCAAVGSIIEFWGFKRVMGRIWTLLYLADRPQSAAEICEQLQISTGSASTNLHELLNWGVVRRAVAPSTRVTLYRAETNVWQMVTKVFRERERDRLGRVAGQLREGSQKLRLEAKAKGISKEESSLKKRQADRTDRLADLTSQVVGMLEAFLDSPLVDLGPILDVLRDPDESQD